MSTAAPINRAQRRALARASMRQGAPQRRAHATRDDLIAHHPIALAAVRQRIEAKIHALRTSAGIHAHIGSDAATLANACGRLVYVVAHAARLHGLHSTPEARILAGTASALADVVAIPASLEANRGAILSGLDACARLLPELHTWSLTAGALELDDILAARDFGAGDVRHALGMGAA